MADSAEAAAAINSRYSLILGRAASAGDISGWQGFLAAGSSLSALSNQLGHSGEAINAINAVYTGILGRAAQGADLTGWQGFFAAGSSLNALRVATATSAESANAINGFALSASGQTLDAASLAAYQQSEVNGGSLAAVKLAIVTGPQVTGAIEAAFTQVPSVAPPNAVELAGDQSELLAGVPLALVQQQIAQLAGNAPSYAGHVLTAAISPVTVGSATPSFVYGLLNNDALQTATPETVELAYSGGGISNIINFNPAVDIIQIRSQQAASYSVLQNDMTQTGSGTVITFHSGGQVELAGIAPSQLTAGNFRIV